MNKLVPCVVSHESHTLTYQIKSPELCMNCGKILGDGKPMNMIKIISFLVDLSISNFDRELYYYLMHMLHHIAIATLAYSPQSHISIRWIARNLPSDIYRCLVTGISMSCRWLHTKKIIIMIIMTCKLVNYTLNVSL